MFPRRRGHVELLQCFPYKEKGFKQIKYQRFFTHIGKSFTYFHVQLETLAMVTVLICHKQHVLCSEAVKSFILIGPNIVLLVVVSWCYIISCRALLVHCVFLTI